LASSAAIAAATLAEWSAWDSRTEGNPRIIRFWRIRSRETPN
jgi:hypothetical protein